MRRDSLCPVHPVEVPLHPQQILFSGRNGEKRLFLRQILSQEGYILLIPASDLNRYTGQLHAEYFHFFSSRGAGTLPASSLMKASLKCFHIISYEIQ